MKAFYNITTQIKTLLEADEFCNTVTTGDIFEVDLNKQNIYPLSHIIVNEVRKEKNVLVFNISVLCMDVVDKNKEEVTDKFLDNDNEHDVLNTQLAVALRLVEQLERDSNTDTFMLLGDPSFEPFTERFENYLAGWTVTFDITTPNTMTVC